MTQKTNTPAKKSAYKGMAKRYPITITPELFELWQNHRRSGDVTNMLNGTKTFKKINVSRPILDRALNYGTAVSDDLVQRITEYFTIRIEAEKKMIQALEVEGQ